MAVEPTGRREAILAAVLYLLATFVFTYPLPLLADRAVDNYGDPLLNTWILAWDWHALTTRPLDLFNANIFNPNPRTLAYSENLVFTALLAGPVDALTGNPVLAHNLVLLLAFPLSAMAAYALIRHLTHSPSGALAGGFIFAFAHYRLGQLSHIQLLTAFWIPLALLWLHRFVERPNLRGAALIGLAVGLQWWTSIYFAFYLVFAIILFIAWALAARAVRLTRPIVLGGLLAAAVAAIVVAPGIKPYLDIRATVGARALSDQEGATLADYLHPQPRSLIGQVAGLAGQTWEHTLFPGVVALGLAAVGLASARPRGTTSRARSWLGFYVLLGVLSLVLSFGPTLLLSRSAPPLVTGMPYAWLYWAIPPLAALRVPARLAVLVMLAVAALAGRGVAVLSNRLDLRQLASRAARADIRRLSVFAKRFYASPGRTLVGLGIAVALALEYLATPVPHVSIETGASVPPIYRWLAAQKFDGAIFELPTARTSNITQDLPSIERIARQQYFSTYHWHPLAAGYSGTNAPTFEDVIDYAPAAASPAGIAFLRGLGVSRIIVHRDQMTWDEWATFAESAERQAGLTHVVDVGGSSVYAITPSSQPTPVWSMIPPSGESQYAYLLADNATGVAAVSLQPTPYTAHVEWLNGETLLRAEDFAGEVPSVLDPGPTLIPLLLDPPPGAGSARATATIGGTQLSGGQRPVPWPAGPWTRVEAAFEPGLLLSFFDLPGGEAYTAGEALLVKLAWHRVPPLPNETVGDRAGLQAAVSLQLVNSTGQKATQSDFLFPDVDAWPPGHTLMQRSILALPRDLPPGEYALRAIAYRPTGLATLGVPATLATISIRQPETFHIQHPFEASLGDAVALIGFDAEPSARPGESYRLTLYWRRLRGLDKDYTVFVHLSLPDGSLLTQQDNPPRNGSYPTSAWREGETVIDHYTLAIPSDAAPGTYALAIGMYLPDTSDRLAAFDAAGNPLAGDSVILGNVEVAP